MTPERVTGVWYYLSWPLKLAALLFWIFYLLFFSLYLASAEWVMVTALAGLLGAICLVMYDLRLVAIIWFVGSPTVFSFANNILDALPFATVERGIFFGLSLIVFASFALRKREGLNLDGIEKATLAFLGITLVSMLFNMATTDGVPIKQDIAFYLQGYFMPLMSYWLMRRLEWNETWVKRYLWCMALAGIILMMQGVAQTYLGLDFFMPTWIEVINEGRATGAFSNATEYGIVCLISMLSALLLQSTTDEKGRLFLLYCLAGAAAIGLFLSKTRAPWLAALVCLCLIFAYDKRQRPFLVLTGGLGVAASLVALPFILDSEFFKGRVLELSPIYARITLYAAGVNMVLDHPILGIGFGKTSFQNMKSDYLTSVFGISYSASATTGPPHNEWLGILTMTGVFGFFAYATIHVLIWRKLRAIRQDPDLSPFARLMSVYVLCMFVAQIIISMLIDIGYLIYSTSATFGTIGILASLRERKTRVPKRDLIEVPPPSRG